MQAAEPISRILRGTPCRFHLDVSPLLDENWTGIPNVAAGLARELLRVAPDHVGFFFEDHLIATGAVKDALDRRSGLYLLRDLNQGDARGEALDALRIDGTVTVGIHPSVKRVKRLFDVECSVIHDVSTLITPQFHTAENIAYHMQNIALDLESNAVTFCVSHSTFADLRAYLGIDDGRLAVAYNGIEWPADFPIRAAGDVVPDVEPYFLVLGTREPRKNIGCVLEMLARYPEVMAAHRVVFTGQMGWLEEQQRIPPALDAAIAQGRILFTGFVSDYQKYKLLRYAEASLYPSYFEGFGLPVIESLSVGTPCIASFSSSMPEVGGNLCVYHDPFSAEDLYRAVRTVRDHRLKASPGFAAACAAHAARFTWDGMLAIMLTALEPAIARHAAAGAPSARATASSGLDRIAWRA